ncbi:MAG TPA: ANTAR domain-containing protein [Actinomycetota bacterium]|nr:ANTAR domain-containing protein [Actinomycetota bacterium]
MTPTNRRLRVLVAEGRKELLASVSEAIERLGHEVVEETDLGSVAQVTASKDPEVAIVILGESSQHALGMIDRIVHEATCPVIAVIDVQDRSFVNEAAQRGIFAYVSGGDDPEVLQSSIDIVLRRFREYHDLEGAFGRRAVTERAKGVLMERHGVDEKEAFDMLRTRARASNRKIVDVAQSVLETHVLLPRGSTPREDDELAR